MRGSRKFSDLVVTYDFLPKIGGAHMWMYEVYRRWPEPLALFTRSASRCAPERATEEAFDALGHGSLRIVRSARPVGDISVANPRFLWTMFQHVRELARLGSRAPTLHSVRSFPEGFASLLYKQFCARGARLITYAHGEEILIAGQSRQLEAMARWVYERSDLVIANSENTRRMLADFAPAAQVVCIHPGVDYAAFQSSEADIRAYRTALGWSESTLVVASIARMEARKNQEGVIRAIKRLHEQGLPVGYVCAGDGDERSALERLVQELALAEWVRFVGRVDERQKRLIYGACDVYAMPSIQIGAMIEGFGIVFIEAAAAGKPSIAGTIGGQPEAVMDGKTGWLVDGRNIEEMAAVLARVARDPRLAKSMAEACRAWAQQHDWTHIVQRTRELIGALEPK